MAIGRFEDAPCCGGDPNHTFYHAAEKRVMCGLCGHGYEPIGVQTEDLGDDDPYEVHVTEYKDDGSEESYTASGKDLNDVVNKLIDKKREEIADDESEPFVLIDHKKNAPVVVIPSLYSQVTGINKDHVFALPRYRMDEIEALTIRVREYLSKFRGETFNRQMLADLEEDIYGIALRMLLDGEITSSGTVLTRPHQ